MNVLLEFLNTSIKKILDNVVTEKVEDSAYFFYCLLSSNFKAIVTSAKKIDSTRLAFYSSMLPRETMFLRV